MSAQDIYVHNLHYEVRRFMERYPDLYPLQRSGPYEDGAAGTLSPYAETLAKFIRLENVPTAAACAVDHQARNVVIRDTYLKNVAWLTRSSGLGGIET
ncbi:hypothetical protein DL769_006383 [Monosporascus sp. CRB-8-3]|nr:hypothetical protein DL769_006383 [Monosporascus sp. CRB-8-3]